MISPELRAKIEEALTANLDILRFQVLPRGGRDEGFTEGFASALDWVLDGCPEGPITSEPPPSTGTAPPGPSESERPF